MVKEKDVSAGEETLSEEERAEISEELKVHLERMAETVGDLNQVLAVGFTSISEYGIDEMKLVFDKLDEMNYSDFLDETQKVNYATAKLTVETAISVRDVLLPLALRCASPEVVEEFKRNVH